jgi:hypothetical protein
VVGDFGHEDLCLDPGHFRRALLNCFGALVELAPLLRMIPLDEEVEGDEHAEHFFFVDLHAAANAVGVGRRVQARGCDEILFTEQQAGALRPTDPLSAGERHQVEAHTGVLPQVLHRWHVGSGIVEGRNPVFLPELRKLLVFNLADEVVGVVEEHHGGLVVDGPLQLLSGFDFDDPHAAVANGVVVAEAVRFLGDDFALHARHVGKRSNLLPVGPGEHGRRSQRQRRRGARGHHRRLAAEQRRNPFAHPIVELVEHDVMFGGIVDRLHHFGRHQRRGHRRVGPGGVDERTHAQLTEVIPLAFCRRSRGGQGRAGPDQPSHQRHR